MQLYEPLHDRLSRFIHGMVWNRENARDVMSETLLRAYENFDHLRKEESFLYYLFSTASRIVYRQQRRKKFWGIFNEEQASSIAVQSHVEAKLDTDILYSAMQHLPVKQREALSLFSISGLSIKEIASVQESTESGVKSRLIRARSTLNRLLKEEEKKTGDLHSGSQVSSAKLNQL